MRNANGYLRISCEDGSVIECDTVHCKHCGKHTRIEPKQNPAEIGGFCTVCTGYVCSDCVGKGCDVVEKKLERAEAAYHARRSYGL